MAVRGARRPGAPSAAAWRPRLGALVLAGCAQGTGSGGAAGTLTVYSGQHVQTTQALVAAFETQTGISVNLRSDDEDVLADQIVTEGSHSPADVYLHRELAAAAVPGLEGPAGPGRPVDAGQHAVALQLARTASGSACRPG